MFTEPSLVTASTSRELKDDDGNDRLQKLLLNFLKVTNLPMTTVSIPEFQDLVSHLNPKVKIPSFDSIIEYATVHSNDSVLNVMLSMDKSDHIPPLNLKEFPSQSEIDDVMKGTTSKDYPYTCLVCLKPRKLSAVRKLVPRDSSIFLLVCIAERVFSLEVAQKLFAEPNTWCCIGHFKPVVKSAMKVMEITNPDDIIRSSEQTVAVANSVINSIKYPNLGDNEMEKSGGSGFRCSLRAFFKRHCTNQIYMEIHIPERNNSAPKKEVRKIEVLEEVMRKKRRLQDEQNFPEDFLEP